MVPPDKNYHISEGPDFSKQTFIVHIYFTNTNEE